MKMLIDIFWTVVAIIIGFALCVHSGATWAGEPERCFTKKQLDDREDICAELAYKPLPKNRKGIEQYRHGMLCRVSDEEGVIYIFECEDWQNDRLCRKPVNRICSLTNPVED